MWVEGENNLLPYLISQSFQKKDLSDFSRARNLVTDRQTHFLYMELLRKNLNELIPNREGRGHWAIYYTSPHSLIIVFSYSWIYKFVDFYLNFVI